jgi:hypothetical protein
MRLLRRILITTCMSRSCPCVQARAASWHLGSSCWSARVVHAAAAAVRASVTRWSICSLRSCCHAESKNNNRVRSLYWHLAHLPNCVRSRSQKIPRRLAATRAVEVRFNALVFSVWLAHSRDAYDDVPTHQLPHLFGLRHKGFPGHARAFGVFAWVL